MRKKISSKQRAHQDYLRKKGLAAGKIYAARLVVLRRNEVSRLLKLCMNYDDVTRWSGIIANNLNESTYLYDWTTGLYLAAGLPNAKSVTRDLSKGKADAPSGIWEQTLRSFASNRCGQNIVSVSGTLRDDLQKILSDALEEDVNISVESLVKRVKKDFAPLNLWQARRIAQTETMIGLAESADIAAQSTEVQFIKEWCISGVGNTRPTHLDMDGVTVDQNEVFELEDCRVMYPHDTSMNAPAGEIINCACSCIRIPK